MEEPGDVPPAPLLPPSEGQPDEGHSAEAGASGVDGDADNGGAQASVVNDEDHQNEVEAEMEQSELLDEATVAQMPEGPEKEEPSAKLSSQETNKAMPSPVLASFVSFVQEEVEENNDGEGAPTIILGRKPREISHFA